MRAGDELRYTRLAHQFHRAINLAARSPRLAIMLGTMTRQLPNTFYGKIEGRVLGSLEHHPRIFDVIEASDAEAARRLMSEHVGGGGDMLVDYLEQQGIWSVADEVADPPRVND